jgi:hypothetical protein
MALDFPANPTLNQEYTLNGRTWLWNGSGWIQKPVIVSNQFGSASSYSEFESDGTLKFNGEATVWQDIDFPIIIRSTGTNIPSLATLQGNITAPRWQVNDFNVCEDQEIPHGWKEGSAIQWHIHVITGGTDTTNRYLKFEIEWCYAVAHQVLSGSGANTITTSSDLLIPANTPAKTQLPFGIGSPIALTGVTIGSQIYARLKRIAATGTAPTADPFVTMLQIHAEFDTVGSRQITTK